MIFHKTPIAGLYTIDPEPFRDERGLFARTFCRREFEEIDHEKEFVQFNHSHTNDRGTLRGMHWQYPPHAEIKLIRCVRGAVLDVVIDIRQGSPTFLRHFAVELSAENLRSIYVPGGFAHGFQTLEDHSELIYHHTAFYTPGTEGGIRWDDPLVGIEWPMQPTVLSERDRNHPLLTDDFTGIAGV
jgi:dTDP-4-dehydrorhamnose 3,5-epimerase